jgi:DNA-binding response OmpR family regulator
MAISEASKKEILVVEDDLTLLRALSDELIGEGFRVIDAKDGEVAYKTAIEKHPDLILLDIMLPSLDGFSVMERLRRDEWGKNVPIIILTALEPDDIILHIINKSRPAYYLVKSKWKLEDIVQRVKEVLELE